MAHRLTAVCACVMHIRKHVCTEIRYGAPTYDSSTIIQRVGSECIDGMLSVPLSAMAKWPQLMRPLIVTLLSRL